MELTPGEHQLLDHIVAAHQKYTIPLEEAKKFVGIQHTQPALLKSLLSGILATSNVQNALLCSYRKLQVLRKVFSTCLRRLLSMSRCWWISPKDSQVSFFLWGSLEELNQTGGMNQRKIQVLRKGFKLIICTSDLPFTCHEDKLEAFSSKLCYD